MPPSTPQVLVIDDEPEIKPVLTAALEGENLTLAFARDAHEGLMITRHRRVDLILLDVGLPEIDGFSVLEQIKQNPSIRHIPVVMLTAADSTENIVKGFDLGAADYITKPFEIAELRARVGAAVRSKLLKDELTRANKELEAARNTAIAAARAKSDFLANMSHEIRTPMNGVLSMADLLLASELSEEQRELADIIRHSGESLLTIINDILDFSKIESGKLELEEHPFSLRSCVEEVLDLLAAKAAEKGLDLAYDFDDRVADGQIGDVTRLRQILVNLVGNAIKFTQRGEVVVLVRPHLDGTNSISQPGTEAADILFTVRDTGIGIPASRIDRLFQSFSQVDASTTRQYGGTGLGLAISRRLVELMGGEMWVKSEEGRGSEFEFNLPSRPESRNETSHFANLPRLKGFRLLIVDDNATYCRILSKCAHSWGMSALAVDGPAEALARIERGEPFDFAVLDHHMPGMDGITLARRIRTTLGSKAMPLILLTSKGSKPDPQDPASSAFAACVAKPLKPALLNTALIRAIDGAQTETRKSRGAATLDATLASRYPLRILLAEDNPINQKVAERVFQRMGYQVTLARNGLEAVQLGCSGGFDLIFMDVQMPEMDGTEASTQIRLKLGQSIQATESVLRTPAIIAMTANAMAGDREKCLNSGMDDYLSKPVQSETLQSIIQTWAVKLRLGSPDSAGSVSRKESYPVANAATSDLTDPCAIEWERLNGVVGSDPERLRDFIEFLLGHTRDQIDRIEAALRRGSAAEICRLAHGLIGSSGTCGLTTLAARLREIESQAETGRLEMMPVNIQKIRSDLDRIRSSMETQLNLAFKP